MKALKRRSKGLKRCVLNPLKRWLLGIGGKGVIGVIGGIGGIA